MRPLLTEWFACHCHVRRRCAAVNCLQGRQSVPAQNVTLGAEPRSCSGSVRRTNKRSDASLYCSSGKSINTRHMVFGCLT